MEIFFFIGLCVLAVWIHNLRLRVDVLERLLGGKTAPQADALGRESVVSPSLQGSLPAHFPPLPSVRPLPAYTQGPDASDRFVEWLKEDWLLKLGAFLLLIGFGWFASYAFLHNWIGPFGRITLGVLAGTGFLVFGWWRMQKYVHQGGVFLVLGSTVILLTLFAARTLYDLFTPLSALVTMCGSTACVALASVQYRNRALALASLALAGIAPLLTNSPHPDYIGLFAYLAVVVVGTLWVVAVTGQRELTLAALILIALYSLPHFFSGFLADRGVLLLFAYGFTGLFFVTNCVGILKLKGKDIFPDLVTAAGNGMFVLVWILVAVPQVWQSLVLSAWMVVFAVGAFLLFQRTGRHEPLYVYAGVGVVMLAAATAAELDGAVLTIAYTLESAMITLVAYALRKDVRVGERASMLLAGPILLSLSSLVSTSWSHAVFQEDFFVLLVMTGVLFGLGILFSADVKNASVTAEEAGTHHILLVLGSAYAYALLWLSLHAALANDDTAVMLSLLVYTVVGITTYLQGMTVNNKSLRVYGSVLLMCVVARLLLVDVWKMELGGRIVTFFLVGALLMSTAFLGKKNRNTNPPLAH